MASRGLRAFLPSGKKNESKKKTASLKDRPQRRSALVARELTWLDIDIAALSEVHRTRLPHGGWSRLHILFWSGKNKDERRLSGVGFMIKTSIARKLQSLPVGHSDRIMSLRLPIQDNTFATVLSVYAPALQAKIGIMRTVTATCLSCSKLTPETNSSS